MWINKAQPLPLWPELPVKYLFHVTAITHSQGPLCFGIKIFRCILSEERPSDGQIHFRRNICCSRLDSEHLLKIRSSITNYQSSIINYELPIINHHMTKIISVLLRFCVLVFDFWHSVFDFCFLGFGCS